MNKGHYTNSAEFPPSYNTYQLWRHFFRLPFAPFPSFFSLEIVQWYSESRYAVHLEAGFLKNRQGGQLRRHFILCMIVLVLVAFLSPYLHYHRSYILLTNCSGYSERSSFVWTVETRASLHAHRCDTIAYLVPFFISLPLSLSLSLSAYLSFSFLPFLSISPSPFLPLSFFPLPTVTLCVYTSPSSPLSLSLSICSHFFFLSSSLSSSPCPNEKSQRKYSWYELMSTKKNRKNNRIINNFTHILVY